MGRFFLITAFNWLYSDEEPSEQPLVDKEAINSLADPQLVISWTKPADEDGGNLLSMYIVTIETSTPTSRRKRATNVARIPVPLNITTYSQPATPFTQYITQVLGDLITGNTVPITGRTTVSTAERRKWHSYWNTIHVQCTYMYLYLLFFTPLFGSLFSPLPLTSFLFLTWLWTTLR